MESASASPVTEVKRVALENLSKDELLQKCKGLLSIAQRAKAAKDGASEEIKALKNEIEKLNKDKCEVEATRVMIESLTAQKLQLTIQLDQVKSTCQSSKLEVEKLREEAAINEVQIESLRRQLARSEADYNSMEARLERMDAENRRMAAVANEAEAQLRRGAVERQDALEGLGDELANVKNAAAEALAERDRLKAQLQQQSPGTDHQVLLSCQELAQELRTNQSVLRADVAQLQEAALAMAAELNNALAEAPTITENEARIRSKDMLAEMNETVKVRGEVAAQLAQKLAETERDRDGFAAKIEEHVSVIRQLEETCRALRESKDEEVSKLLQERTDSDQKLTELNNVAKNQTDEVAKLMALLEENERRVADSETALQQVRAKLDESKAKNEKLSSELDERASKQKESNEKLSELQRFKEDRDALMTEVTELKNQLSDVETLSGSLEQNLSRLEELTNERDILQVQLEKIKLVQKVNQDSIQLMTVQDENTKLKQKLTEIELEKRELLNTVTLLEDKVKHIEAIKKENLDSKEKMAKMEDLKNSLETKANTLQNEMESAKLKLEDLQQENCTLKANAEKHDEVVALLEKLQSAHLQRENEIVSLVAELKNLQEKQTLAENAVCSNIDATKEVTELEEKNKELSSLVTSLREKLLEFEKEREECEGASVSTVSRTDDACRLRDVEESFEERYTKLRAVAVKLKQKCHDQANMLTKMLNERSELQSKVMALGKDRDALAKNVQSIQVACDAAADEAEAAKEGTKQSTKELKRAGEELAAARNLHAEAQEKADLLQAQLQQIKSELEAARQQNKKSSVLNLEMAAYERSAEEQDKKLAQMKEELEALKLEVESQKKVATERLDEASKWEEDYKQATSHRVLVEEQLSLLKTQLGECQGSLTDESKKLADAISRFETKRSELERVELQLAEITAEKLHSEEASKVFKEQVARKIRNLEEKINESLDTIKSRDEELTSLRAEFDGYKARAQAVLLRQQQQKPSSKEDSRHAELENDLTLLKSLVERLQGSLTDAATKERVLQGEISSLTNQNSALQTSTRELATQLAELGKKCDDLTKRLQRSEDIAKEAARQHKLAVDTLASSYKAQLAEAERRHKTQMASLEAQQEEAALQSEHDTVQPVLQEREEGEGSENIDSPKPGTGLDNKREPIALDRLLSSDLTDEVRSEVSIDAASISSALQAEKRAKHLAALLGEAEADLARLSQQNSVLKEEIRRQQRCMERTQHTISNSEYLKNVVVKFITLQGGDEKARLVPVLNTILKLSPEETKQLQEVASGSAAGPEAISGASWGSYLHLWSGTH